VKKKVQGLICGCLKVWVFKKTDQLRKQKKNRINWTEKKAIKN